MVQFFTPYSAGADIGEALGQSVGDALQRQYAAGQVGKTLDQLRDA